MSENNKLLIGGNGTQTVYMDASMANRHGMIAGATGTGKTVTLQILAENFSKIGVPVFLADVKGDISGVGKEAVLCCSGRSCGKGPDGCCFQMRGSTVAYSYRRLQARHSCRIIARCRFAPTC